MKPIGERSLVVFVHGSADLYGSDRVLLHLAQSLVESVEFVPLVVLHEDGPLRLLLAAAGVEVHVGTVVKITRAMFRPRAAVGLIGLLASACRGLDRLVAGRRVALVHSNTLAVLGGAWWARRRRLPHLWHVHEIILRPGVVRRGLPWLVDRSSQLVISNSRPTETWLLAEAPNLAGRSRVIYNGLPPLPEADAAGLAASASFRHAIGAGDGDVVVTLAGRLNAWKGQALAIEALARLQQAGRLGRLRLAIVGNCVPGQEHIGEALQQRVVALGLQERVGFVGFVDDIFPVWRASQIALVPSIEPEPFGMVAIEAMACGLPVIAAGHGGLLDIVVDAETGLLVKPRDVDALAQALHQLAVDGVLREQLGAAGRQRQIDEFSVQRQIVSTHALYRELACR